MKILDRLAFPLLVLLSPEQSERLGLTPIDSERANICLKNARGRLLDIGCGTNALVRQHPSGGFGVDIFPRPGVDAVCKSNAVPFGDQSFDTVTMVAMLNHIPQGERVLSLQEVRRVLHDDGRLLITMIGPLIGLITHRLRYAHDPDQLERGIGHDEDLGLSDGEVRRLLRDAGFVVERRIRFVWRLNNLYICRKSRS